LKDTLALVDSIPYDKYRASGPNEKLSHDDARIAIGNPRRFRSGGDEVDEVVDNWSSTSICGEKLNGSRESARSKA
jgi:hypothetical protein